MKKLICLFIGTLAFSLAGCQEPTKNVDIVNDEGKPVMALDYRDFDQASSLMVQSLLKSPALKKPDGTRYVMATSRIVNDTMQRIDVDQLLVKIRQELLNSGQVIMTAAIGREDATDPLIGEARTLRTNDEFDPNTVAAKKTLIAPELTLSGKIFQSVVGYTRGVQQVEYYFQLKVANVKTGLVIWENEQLIAKRGSSRSVSW